MPSGEFAAPAADWTHLRRTRRLLTEGGDLRLLALGDSIVNDTMRSGWVAKLQEAYPKARIQATVYVRGGGGCQHYREEDRVAKNIIPQKPDLVLIGGISQKNVESIRDVVHANEFGEQILAKIMMSFWTAPDHPESAWLPERLEWFQDQQFGFMMHWAPYSQWGCIESWPLVEEEPYKEGRVVFTRKGNSAYAICLNPLEGMCCYS